MDKVVEEREPQAQHVENGGDSKGRRDSFDSVDREAVGGKDMSEMPRHYYRNPKVVGSIIAFIITYEAGFLSYIMLANSLMIIDNDIGPSQDIIWVILAVTLGQSIAFPIAGRLSDLFGRRWYFIGANTLALIGYIVCSRAKTVDVLIGGNILIGIGSAVQIAGSAVPGELVPNRQRFFLFVVIVAALGPVTALAPAISRSFCDDTEQGWRWIYYFLAILTFVGIVLFLLCYYPPTFHNLHKHSSKWQTIKTLDYVGIVIFSGSTASLLMGISWGGQKYPWRSSEVIVTIVIGGIGLIVLGLWEHYSKPLHPFIPTSLLMNRNYVMLTICSCVGSMVFYALSILWPQQLVALFRLSSSRAGWASCTLTGGVLLGWLVSGGLVHRLKFFSVKNQLILCCVIFTAFIGATAAADGTNMALGISVSLIGAAGIGYLETVSIAGAPLHLDPKDIGLANGVQYSLRTITSSLSTSIYVTILNNKVASNMAKYAFPAAIEAGLSQSSAAALISAITAGDESAVMKIPGITPQAIQATTVAATKAYFKSFQIVYYTSIAFGGCAIIAACCVNGKVMQAKLTPDIARKLQHLGKKHTSDVEDISEKKG